MPTHRSPDHSPLAPSSFPQTHSQQIGGALDIGETPGRLDGEEARAFIQLARSLQPRRRSSLQSLAQGVTATVGNG